MLFASDSFAKLQAQELVINSCLIGFKSEIVQRKKLHKKINLFRETSLKAFFSGLMQNKRQCPLFHPLCLYVSDHVPHGYVAFIVCLYLAIHVLVRRTFGTKIIKTVITLHKNMIFLSTLSAEGHSLRFYRELLDKLLTILLHCQPAHPPPASAHRSSFDFRK